MAYEKYDGKYEGLIAFGVSMVIALVIWVIIFQPDWHLILDFILPGR